jgi:hypothetical protein
MQYAAPDLVGKLKTFPRGSTKTKKQLSDALRASEKMIARFLERCEASGKVHNWKGSPPHFSRIWSRMRRTIAGSRWLRCA